MVDRRGTPYEMGQFIFELGHERRVMLVLCIGVLEFIDGVGQCFADEAAAVGSEMACRIRLLVGVHGVTLQIVRRLREPRRQTDGSRWRL